MKYAKIRLTWEPTKDPRVTEHRIRTFIAGSQIPIEDIGLPPSVDHLDFILPSFTQIHVRSTVISEEGYSESVLDFEIPDLSKPVAVNNLGWTLLEIFEYSQPENVEQEELLDNDEEIIPD
jgi:hypothetical protein